jgi:hypothetical protein
VILVVYSAACTGVPCQEHMEMKGRLSESIASEMTHVNATPIQEIQEMKSTNEKKSPESSSANNTEHTNLEIQAL